LLLRGSLHAQTSEREVPSLLGERGGSNLCLKSVQVAKQCLVSTSPVPSPAGFCHLEQQKLKSVFQPEVALEREGQDRETLSAEDIFLLFPHPALPHGAPSSTGVPAWAVEEPQQQEGLQQAVPICSNSSAITAFILGNSKRHQTNAELAQSTALTALKAEVPPPQRVRLGLQLSQLLQGHLHQHHPCSDARGPPVRIKGAGRTRSSQLQTLSPVMVVLPEGHLSISKTSPRPHRGPTERQRLLLSRPGPHGARTGAWAAHRLPLASAAVRHSVLGRTRGAQEGGRHLPHTPAREPARQGEAACERLGVTSTLSLVPKTSMLKLIYPCLSSTAFL